MARGGEGPEIGRLEPKVVQIKDENTLAAVSGADVASS
jgi:hypothetical protein